MFSLIIWNSKKNSYQVCCQRLLKWILWLKKSERSTWKAKNCKLCGTNFDNDKVRHHDQVTGCYIEPRFNRCNMQLKFRKGKSSKKRKSGPFNHGERKILCNNADIISDDAEIDDLDPSQFEMNEDNFTLPVFFTTWKDLIHTSLTITLLRQIYK